MDQKINRTRVPSYHRESEHSDALLGALEGAAAKAEESFADLIKQFFPQTATWGLRFWEQQLGIKTDEALSTETRRAAVLRQLMPAGTVSVDMIRQIAKDLTGYGTQITENDDYSFSLRFYGTDDALVEIDTQELRAAVEILKPAHLRFEIPGPTWQDLDELNITWQDLGRLTWGQLQAQSRVHAVDGITFSVSGNLYRAKQGQTWAQWVESEQNPGTFEVIGNMVYCSSVDGYVSDCRAADAIEEDVNYRVLVEVEPELPGLEPLG